MVSIRKLTHFLLLWIVVLCTYTVPVMAEEAFTVSIPVACQAEGSSETFKYILSPENSREGQVVLTGLQNLKNGEEGAFVLNLNLPGTYSYKAEQFAGSRTDTAYSRQVYIVQALVTEGEDGALKCEIIAYQDGSTEKTDRLLFTNKVTAPTVTPGSSKTTNTPKKEQKSTSSAQSRTAERVKTGDKSRPALFAGLGITAIIIIITVLKSRKTGGR